VTDLVALKAALADPREVARLLGLRVVKTCAGGVYVQCPVHGSKKATLGLRNQGGGLQAHCFSCCFGPRGKGGDVLTLLTAMEQGDVKRGIARAVELAGGASLAPYTPPQEPPRLDPAIYAALAEKVLCAGRLDGRRSAREVEAYLASRRLLEAARGDGWASLPPLPFLLALAAEVCEERGSRVPPRQRGADTEATASPVAFAFTPASLLVAARLARYGEDGRLAPVFGAWRCVIPWRAPDGSVVAMQRRRTWAHTGDTEPAKYVLPWAPEWPYGVERLGEDGLSSGGNGRKGDGVRKGGIVLPSQGKACARGVSVGARISADGGRGDNGRENRKHAITAIVEGAVDTLALRLLYPRVSVVGLPGIGGWHASWASLFVGREVRVALDRGKPDQRGVIHEARAAARIALDLAGDRRELPEKLDACVMCGAPEPGLCGIHGRRLAPLGEDWGSLWAGLE